MPPKPRKLPQSFYEKFREMLDAAEKCTDPDLKKLILEAASRYYQADISLGLSAKDDRGIDRIMAMADSPTPTAPNGSPLTPTSTFYRFLEQALTLGTRGISKSALPRFIGFLVYAALIGLLTSSLLLNLGPQVTASAIVLLMLAGVMSIVLLLEIPKKVRPVIFEIILLLVVICFLGVSTYAVVKLLNVKPVLQHEVSDKAAPITKVEPPDLEARQWKTTIRADGFPAFEGQVKFGADQNFEAQGQFLVPTEALNERIECPAGLKGGWSYGSADHFVLRFQMHLTMFSDAGISKDQYLQCSSSLKPLASRVFSKACIFRSAVGCSASGLDIHLSPL